MSGSNITNEIDVFVLITVSVLGRIGDGDKGIASAHRAGSYNSETLTAKLRRPAGAVATGCTLHLMRRFGDNPWYSNTRHKSATDTTLVEGKTNRDAVQTLFKAAVRTISIAECDNLMSQMPLLDVGIATYLSKFDKTYMYQSYLIRAGVMTMGISNNNADEVL
jgi:hypothetical protein